MATLPGGFVVEEGRAPRVWVDIVGFGRVVPTAERAFTILCGNSGDTDAFMVPLTIMGIPKDASFRLSAVNIVPPQQPVEDDPIDFSQVPLDAETDTDFHVPLYILRIPAGATLSFRLTVRAPNRLGEFELGVVAEPPLMTFASQQGRLTQSGLKKQGTLPEVMQAFLRDLVTTPQGALKLQAALQLILEALGLADDLPPDLTKLINKLFLQFFLDFAQTSVGIGWSVGGVLGGEGGFPQFLDTNAGNLTQLLLGALKFALTGVGKNALLTVIPILRVINAIRFVVASANLIDKCIKFNEARKKVQIVASLDPNDKVGAEGAGAQRFISGEEPLRYGIFFENLETATAPAQEVIITDQLDTTTMDLSTFSLGPIAFGDIDVLPGPGLRDFTTDVDLRPAKNLIVRVNAHLDTNTGLLTYRLTSLDPATGQLPEDPLLGFLPPNKNPPEGDGSVVFTVMPKQGLPTGTVIRNKARIFFDLNAPIDTPEWFNTLDNDKPTSQMDTLPAQSPTTFTLNWQGTDQGSGVQDFTVFVSDDGGPFEPLLINTTQTSTTFQGQFGHTYGFLVIARDNAFNVEDAPNLPDAVTSAVNAVDVTAQLRINRGKINQPVTRRGYVQRTFRRRGGGTGPATQTVTIKNKSGTPIQGPLSLVLDQLSPNATLFNATGRTANAAPLGSPFIVVNVGDDNVLSPNEAVKVLLEFTNPSGNRITYRARILAGEGAR